MSLFETHRRGNHVRKSSFLLATAALCVLLMTLLAVAQAVHRHSNPEDAYTCPLCVATHTVVPSVAAAALIILVQVGIAVTVPKVLALARYWNPKFVTRPPPGVC